MTTFKKLIAYMFVGALLLAVNALPALAQSTGSDGLLVFDPAGNIFASVVVSDANEDPSHVYFINDPTLADPNQFGNATNLIEPNGALSDIFGVGDPGLNGGRFLAFSSDTETLPEGNGGAPIRLPEGNGGPFDATIYLNPNLRAQGFTARFFSDTEIPEPSSVVLFGLGALGLAIIGRRKIKTR